MRAGRRPPWVGLRKNITRARPIPAGTGLPLYREIETRAPDYQPMEFYSSGEEEDEGLADWLAERSEAVSDDGGAEVIDLPTGSE